MNKGKGSSVDTHRIFDSPVHSDVEAKLRNLLIELGKAEKILGIQVCAYKDGKVIIDTAAGTLGRDDPRPVKPDSLFPVFSATKGITAGMLHWLVDNGAVRLDDDIASIWPEFGANGKEKIKVHHVLNHTSGLHNAMAQQIKENPTVMLNWDECLKSIVEAAPETEPGSEQLYHSSSFGWLCGGIIEHASGKKFQDILDESFIYPLNIEGELYIGVPPGVESRLASLTLDTKDINKFSAIASRPDLPSTLQPHDILQMVTTLPALFNALDTRRAIIPASNGHCSARALARYYAALVDAGAIPPPHSCISKPPLGSHPHIPEFPTVKNAYNRIHRINSQISVDSGEDRHLLVIEQPVGNIKLFKNPKIVDAFMGVGEYEYLALPNEPFGLGFKRSYSKEGDLIGFGHAGVGGSRGYCDIKHNIAIAVTVNKLSMGTVTAKIIHLVFSELGIPVPKELLGITEASSSNNISTPIIN